MLNPRGHSSKNAPKAPNEYSVNTVIKYFEHMIQGDHFNLAFVSENAILTILKATEVSKVVSLDSLSGRFLKDGAIFLAKHVSYICNLSMGLFWGPPCF